MIVIRTLRDPNAGLLHMHANNILHRDLKPDNMLINAQDGKYTGLVGDLGLCAIHDPRDRTCHQPATEYWRAPECELVNNHGKVRPYILG